MLYTKTMSKEIKVVRKQKQAYLPEEVCTILEDYRKKYHVFSDNQAIINLIIIGAESLNTKENGKEDII